ncbi:phosphatase PAP2 family protein [Sanguibacter suarezii]|uniref:phosphatase PAP2 family protein n=1 Tax=Sanguibacter suarezii TaxID=60921 RepID=UPI0008323162|nr:phosphatase PAP2 family protein [Sanguibacter suarezii]
MDSPTIDRRSVTAVLVTVLPGLILVVLGVVGFFVVFDAVYEKDDLAALDTPVLEWLADNRSSTATTVLTVVTNLFGPVVLPIIVAIGCLVWAKVSGGWRDPLLLVAAMLTATAISVLIKALVARPRPPEGLMSVPGVESSFSFPSGHTIGAATLVLVSGYLVWTRHHSRTVALVWTATAVVVIALVAFSRLYLGYHFVTDVLAAVCLALAVLGAVVMVYHWTDRKPLGDRAD